MNSLEPIKAMLQNVQLGEESRPIPEQTVSQIPVTIPRSISFVSTIHQWQPMGIRVVVNLPFVSDDASPLFIIRNGPYLHDFNEEAHAANGDEISEWAFNQMRAVRLIAPAYGSFAFPKNYGISLSYFDSPPLLSQISRCFRRWRGDLQYRLRLVAGFVTQGYIIVTPIKNSPMNMSVMNYFGTFDQLKDTDPTSYRSKMQNAYIMSDCSMYRHVEVTYPYEYPTPWYDQFQWIANRLVVPSSQRATIIQEPFGDNWLAVCLRGALEPTRDTSQMSFELEYRAMEGFQFADPNLPPNTLHRPKFKLPRYEQNFKGPLIIPSTKYVSDGINAVTTVTPPKNRGPGMKLKQGSVHHEHHEFSGDLPLMDTVPRPRFERAPSPEDFGVDVVDLDSNSSPLPTLDQRTPSQRRRDAEFSY